MIGAAHHRYWQLSEMNCKGRSSNVIELKVVLKLPLAATIRLISDHTAQLWKEGWLQVLSKRMLTLQSLWVETGVPMRKLTTFDRALADSFHMYESAARIEPMISEVKDACLDNCATVSLSCMHGVGCNVRWHVLVISYYVVIACSSYIMAIIFKNKDISSGGKVIRFSKTTQPHNCLLLSHCPPISHQ